jgi:hypothetical protein
LGYIQADTAKHLDDVVVHHFDVVDFQQMLALLFIHSSALVEGLDRLCPDNRQVLCCIPCAATDACTSAAASKGVKSL